MEMGYGPGKLGCRTLGGEPASPRGLPGVDVGAAWYALGLGTLHSARRGERGKALPVRIQLMQVAIRAPFLAVPVYSSVL